MLLRAYPDPDTETTTCDGYASSGSSVWNTIVTATSSSNTPTSTAASEAIFLNDDLGASYLATRSIFLFDTSSIPDTDTIGKAIFALMSTGANTQGGGDCVMQGALVTSDPASNTDYVAGDWDSIGGTALSDSNVTLATFVAATSARAEWDMNATGIAEISKTGVTKLAIRGTCDINDTAPSARNYCIGYFADQTGTDSDPVLVVTYGAGGVIDTSYPDPDTETTTVDGYVGNYNASGQTWASLIAESTGSAADDTGAQAGFRIRSTSGGTTRDVTRTFFLFDTSSIGSSPTIDEATQSFMAYQAALNSLGLQNGSEFLNITSATPASNTALATSDYNQVDGAGTSAGTRLAADFDLESDATFSLWSTTDYNDFVYNASGLAHIAKTGVTKTSLRFIDDIDTTQPDASNGADSNAFVYIYWADQSGTGNDPILIVAYTDGTTVSPSAQTATFSLPAETVTGEATISVNTQSLTTSLPAATFTADWTVSPNAQVATFTIPAYTAQASGVTIAANAQALTFSLPTEQILAGAVLSPNGQTLTFTVPASTVTADWTVLAEAQSLTVSVPTLAFIGAVWSRLGRNDGDWTRSARNDDY